LSSIHLFISYPFGLNYTISHLYTASHFSNLLNLGTVLSLLLEIWNFRTQKMQPFIILDITH